MSLHYGLLFSKPSARKLKASGQNDTAIINSTKYITNERETTIAVRAEDPEVRSVGSDVNKNE